MLDEISRGIKKARLSERAFVWSVADAAMQVVTCDTTEQGEQDSVDQAQACDAGDQPDEHREMHKRQENVH